MDKKIIIQYTSAVNMFSSNSAVLVGAYMVLCLHMTAEDAYKKLIKKGSKLNKFAPFRDAGKIQSHFLVGIDDVIKAIEIAKLRGWYDHNYFDVKEYNRLASLFDGDMNWIIPGKILATSSPSVCEAEG